MTEEGLLDWSVASEVRQKENELREEARAISHRIL